MRIALYLGHPSLQTQVTLSTTETEYIAMSLALQDAIPIMFFFA